MINIESFSKEELIKFYGSMPQDLRKVADASGVVIISPTNYLCDEVNCPSVTSNGDPIYKDMCHLRPVFVRTQVHYLDEVFQ